MSPENADNAAEMYMVPLLQHRTLITTCTFRQKKLQYLRSQQSISKVINANIGLVLAEKCKN
jgi:hypothetical protein